RSHWKIPQLFQQFLMLPAKSDPARGDVIAQLSDPVFLIGRIMDRLNGSMNAILRCLGSNRMNKKALKEVGFHHKARKSAPAMAVYNVMDQLFRRPLLNIGFKNIENPLFPMAGKNNDG